MKGKNCKVVQKARKTPFFSRKYILRTLRFVWRGAVYCRVPRSGKIKSTNLSISSFKKAKFSNRKQGQIKAKFSKKITQNMSNNFWNLIKCCMFRRNFTKIGLKIYFFSLRSEKGQKIAKWPNHFISGKLFQIRLIWPF